MTFPKGHWLDLPELLLAHLGDDALTELQALVSGFVPGFVPIQSREWGKRTAKSQLQQMIVSDLSGMIAYFKQKHKIDIKETKSDLIKA